MLWTAAPGEPGTPAGQQGHGEGEEAAHGHHQGGQRERERQEERESKRGGGGRDRPPEARAAELGMCVVVPPCRGHGGRGGGVVLGTLASIPPWTPSPHRPWGNTNGIVSALHTDAGCHTRHVCGSGGGANSGSTPGGHTDARMWKHRNALVITRRDMEPVARR